jgi:ABC-type lipoprotein release transport system permease subunit
MFFGSINLLAVSILVGVVVFLIYVSIRNKSIKKEEIDKECVVASSSRTNNTTNSSDTVNNEEKRNISKKETVIKFQRS